MPKRNIEDQEPHALLLEELQEEREVSPTRRFPFRPGAKPGSGNMRRAKDALKVFAVLHQAHAERWLTFEELAPLFFRSTSDLITYREGWKAGKYWSREAWNKAIASKNTNGLISEHVLPRRTTLKHALSLSLADAEAFVWKNSFECVITKDENKLVNKHPGNVADPWARYGKQPANTC